MITPLARLGAALVLTLSATLATACTAAPAPNPRSPRRPQARRAPPRPSRPPSRPRRWQRGDPTCETIISDDIVADFESVGWTARADPFYVGELEIPEGVWCVWADFDGQAGDHVQIFGWAPIADGCRRRRAGRSGQPGLGSRGWRRGRLHHREPRDDDRARRRGLRNDLPLRRRLGHGRRHQAGPGPHRVAARLTRSGTESDYAGG